MYVLSLLRLEELLLSSGDYERLINNLNENIMCEIQWIQRKKPLLTRDTIGVTN